MMEFAKEKSCLHYPISYWLIMKYKYANRIFLHLLSGSVRFTSSVTQKIILAVIIIVFFLVVFLDKDVIYLTVKSDSKDFSLRYIDVE